MNLQYFLVDQPVTLRYLAFLRVSTGLILILALVSLLPDADLLLSPDGVVNHALLAVHHRPVVPSYATMVTDLSLSAAGTALVLHGALTLYLLLCLLLAVGYRSRVVAGVLMIHHTLLFTAQPAFSYGFDYVGSMALFYCMLMPPRPNSQWARPFLRMLQAHLCIAYLFSGLEKLLGHTWRNGEALYKALSLPHAQALLPLDPALFGQSSAVFVMGGWLVIVLELGYPIGIWWYRTRLAWLYGIIGLHIGIALLMGLYHFSALMIALNIAAFYFDPPAGRRRQPRTSTPPHHSATSLPDAMQDGQVYIPPQPRNTRKGGIRY